MKMTFRRLGLLALLLASQGWAASAQAAGKKFEDVVKTVEVKIEPASANSGENVTWKFTMVVPPGWHSYPTQQKDPGAKTFVNKIGKPTSPDIASTGELQEPMPLTNPDPDLPMGLQVLEGKVVWKRTLVISPDASTGEKEIAVPVELLVCDANKCLPPKRMTLKCSLMVIHAQIGNISRAGNTSPAPHREGEEIHPETPSGQAAATTSPHEDTESAATATPQTSQGYRAVLEGILAQLKSQAVPKTGLLAFILTGVFWGAVSLVTPCVFPMIPITVSFFLKQSEKAHHRPITMALVYCSTIVVVLTIAAVALLSFFRWLSINPLMNFGLGILFVLFALSLFGMYDLELPNSLARFTSSREGKGGLIGTMFMALTFTIVSFACVAPFLGGFGGAATGSNLSLVDRLLGGLAFSATFASPFFILALFPSLLKKLPKSGSWLNSVKVVMGFLEVAAALMFFRMGELVLANGKPAFFTFDLVLGLCIALMLLCGLYLLGFYRLPYDTPSENLGVMRLVFSFLFLGLAFYLLPAMFRYDAQGEKQRPAGTVYAWFESFLLPEAREGKADLKWTGDLKRAVDEARAENQRSSKRQLVLIDFTGITCKNCKYNESSVFTRTEIRDLFQSYHLVQLFTDTVPSKYYPPSERDKLEADSARQRDDAEVNQWFESTAFGTDQLPLYVILEPRPNGTIDVVATYTEGKINHEDEFVQFLKKPLEANATATARAQVGD